jgi:EmrB/QacA subfamily drug resistance transporter
MGTGPRRFGDRHFRQASRKHTADPQPPWNVAEPAPSRRSAELSPWFASRGVVTPAPVVKRRFAAPSGPPPDWPPIPAAVRPSAGDQPPPAASRHNPWLVLAALCLGFFMILLDTTIVNVAIPDMIDKLDASLDEILWVTNAYSLAYAVLLITAGRIGDLVGARWLYLGGLLLFTAASAACGLARNPEQLIAGRVAQGIGSALLTPQTLSVITMIFPRRERGAAFGVWGAGVGVATVAGPTLGGFIVTHWGWRWIFYVNVPIGIAALLFAAVVMPNLRLNRWRRLGALGTVLATVGLLLVTYGLIEGQAHDWGKVWGPVTIPEVIGAGVLVLVVFGVQQYLQRHREPLVPFPILRDRNFTAMNLVITAVGFGMVGFFLPFVIYLQSVLGMTALEAGFTVAAGAVMAMLVSPIAGRVADKTSGRYLLMAGMSLFAAGIAGIAWSTRTGSTSAQLIPTLLVTGLGMGLTFAPLQTVAMRDVEPRMAGAASGLINTTRWLGAVLGSAAVGAVLQSQLAVKLDAAAERNAAALPEPVRQQFIDGIRHTYAGSLQVGAGQTGIELPPDVPDHVREAFARTFQEGFTDAMRVSLVLPSAVLALAALSCFLVRRPGPRDMTVPSGELAAAAA